MFAGRRCGGLVVAVVLAAAAPGCSSEEGASARRQAEVAERGAKVMPFDLDATTHVFTPTESGGVQLVVADDPADLDQVALIRSHLAEERERFSRGDFDDPAAIHGHDMEGLAELRAGHRNITVSYFERPEGALLTYESDDPALVDAIHAWFGRQVMDHGDHAHGS